MGLLCLSLLGMYHLDQAKNDLHNTQCNARNTKNGNKPERPVLQTSSPITKQVSP